MVNGLRPTHNAAGIRVNEPRGEYHAQGDDGWEGEQSGRDLKIVPPYQSRGNDQRTDHRSELVQRLVKAKGPSASHTLAGLCQHHIARRGARRPPTRSSTMSAAASGQFPATANARNHHHLYTVAQQRDGPIKPA